MSDDKENGNEAGDKAPRALPETGVPLRKIGVNKVRDPNINVGSAILNIIVRMKGVDPLSLKPDTRFREDLGYDDLDFVEFLYAVEEAIEITIPDEVAARIRTIGDAIDAALKIIDSEG